MQGPCDLSQKWRGTLRFLLQLEMSPSYIPPNAEESREAPPNCTVSLTSQRHSEKLPEVAGTSQGNPGFYAVTRERPRESLFNASWGAIPLPWLESNDALPLATRIETWLPWRHRRGSLSSPLYLVSNTTLEPQLENTHETPQSSRDEGLLLLYGLESNPESSLQTPQEAWLILGHTVSSKIYPSRLDRRAVSLASPRDEAWLPGWVENAMLRSLSPQQRNIRSWTQA